ncbi:retrovirus-related pol polyprotein from transposon TNT 1-94 [Tanacetum coccineum]
MHNNIMTAGSRDRVHQCLQQDDMHNGEGSRFHTIPLITRPHGRRLTFGSINLHDGETIESYYTSILQDDGNEISYNNLPVATDNNNELPSERMPRMLTPLALVATAQKPHFKRHLYHQSSKSYKSYAPTSKASLPTRSMSTTRYKGKEIAKTNKKIWLSLQSTQENLQTYQQQPQNFLKYEKQGGILLPRYKNDNQTGQFRNQRHKNVAGARETVGDQVVQQSGIHYFNCKEFGHYAKECRKPKRVKDSTYHKEKILLCKQAEKGVQLQAEQSDWLADPDEEIDRTRVWKHINIYMQKIQSS